MTVTAVEPSLEALDALEGLEAFCLLVGRDERPLQGAAGFLDWRLLGALSRLLQDGFFQGDAGEQLLVPTSGRVPVSKAFAVGVGRESLLDARGLERALEGAAEMLEKAKVESVALALPPGSQPAPAQRADAVRSHFLPRFGGRVVVLADRAVKAALDKGA